MTDSNDAPKNGWNEWAKYVLKTLEKLEKNIEENEKLIQKLMIELKLLQFKTSMKAGFIGALSGFLPSAAVAIYFIIKLSKLANAIPIP